MDKFGYVDDCVSTSEACAGAAKILDEKVNTTKKRHIHDILGQTKKNYIILMTLL